MSRLVIGIGNSFRRDDGVGLTVADEITKRAIPGIGVMTSIGEPGELLDAWAGVAHVVVVDAGLGDPITAGRIQRWTLGEKPEPRLFSSHALGLPQTYALGEALGRIPDRLTVFTVAIADAGLGFGLTAEVAAAIPEAVKAVLVELGCSSGPEVDRRPI